MASKTAPHPPITDETMQALLAATTQFAALAPWLYMHDSDVVGLSNPATSEKRLATVLGNAGEVFGVVFYQGVSGTRWLLNMLNDDEEVPNLESMAAMDALKVEMVPRNQLHRDELRILKKLNFAPGTRGLAWPKFESIQPGWLPWFINQKEAEQLLLDLPRLTAFAILFRDNANLFDERSMDEIPFLPHPMPGRPLQPDDLEWQPLIPVPEIFGQFEPSGKQLHQLGELKRQPKKAYEFGNRLLMGSSVFEQGRPCYCRMSLLVDHGGGGLVLGVQPSLATLPFVECVGNGFVKTLLDGGALPGTILIDDNRLEAVLGAACKTLKIELVPSKSLMNLEEAASTLEAHMRIAF